MFKKIIVYKGSKKIGEQTFENQITTIPTKKQFIKVKGMVLDELIDYVTLNYIDGVIEVTID